MAAVTDIRFRGLQRRDAKERELLEAEKTRLERLKKEDRATDEEKADLDRIKEVLANLPAAELVDPLFVAVRDGFNDSPGLLNKILLNHKKGVLKTGPLPAAAVAGAGAANIPAAVILPGDITDDDVVIVAHVLGILANKGIQPPQVIRLKKANVADAEVAADKKDEPAYGKFTTAFYAAFGEARGSFSLAKLVLPILQQEGDRDLTGRLPGEVETDEFAKVMQCLRDKGVRDDEAQLKRKVNECLDKIQDVVDGSIVDLSIALPDLNEATEFEAKKENVEAFGPLICAAMFDDLKAFAVVDNLFQQWQQGVATIPHGSEAGRLLYKYWKDAPNRMSEAERRNFYALTMGIPGGSYSMTMSSSAGNGNGNFNRDFNDLWIRFVSSVSSLVRARTTDRLLRTTIPASFGQQQVRKAARDLTLNLSSHAYGMVTYAARDLQDQIMMIINLLSHPDTLNLFGARDMWQVIDSIVTLELGGGARNSARVRTLATCGAIITKWLSQNVEKFNSSTSLRQVIDVDDVVSSAPRSAGKNATKKPTDYDLVNACELWLADTAVSDERIEEMAQPRETPAMTSRPVPIPAMARELLEGALPPGLGMGLTRQ